MLFVLRWHHVFMSLDSQEVVTSGIECLTLPEGFQFTTSVTSVLSHIWKGFTTEMMAKVKGVHNIQ